MAATQENQEAEVERLVRELGQVVRSVDAKRQDQLKEFVSTLWDQELIPMETSEDETLDAPQPPMNPLAAGLGLCVLGAGLFFFIPPVAIALGIIGLAGIVWGAAINFTKK